MGTAMSQATENKQETGNQCVLPIILAVLGCIALGITLTWLNTERIKLGYKIDRLQQTERTKKDLHSNLLFERENLLSPKALGKLANKLELYTAKPGQVRRMDLPVKHNFPEGTE